MLFNWAGRRECWLGFLSIEEKFFVVGLPGLVLTCNAGVKKREKGIRERS